MALSFPVQNAQGDASTVMSDFSTAVMAFSKVKALAAAVRVCSSKLVRKHGSGFVLRLTCALRDAGRGRARARLPRVRRHHNE